MSMNHITEPRRAMGVDERLQLLQEEDLPGWLERANAICQRMHIVPTAEHLLTLSFSRTPVTTERLMAEACTLGDHLCRRAITHEGMTVWLSPGLIPGTGEWAPKPVGIDWYDGIAGIALFLGYLGQMTNEQRYRALAETALQSVRFRIKQYRERQKKTGLVAWRSALHLFTHLGRLWHNDALLHEAEMLVEQVPELIIQDRVLDIVAGTAGIIVSLLGLYTLNPSARILEVAQLGGENLLSHATKMEQGYGWQTIVGSPPLTGASHGSAGIAYSLFWLAAVSKDERFHKLALDGLAYERSHFSAEQKNWLDLRRVGPVEDGRVSPSRCRHFWCHGAPGIGLARLGSLPYVHDELIDQEIEAALQTTHLHGFGHNHSLCHGDFGNLETLLVASQTQHPEYKDVTEQLTASLLDSIAVSRWVCGAPLGIETPGLMRGLAGIGYQLLRLAAPERIPSVLLFAPPV